MINALAALGLDKIVDFIREQMPVALREAARIGIADSDAGRFRSFESPAALSRHSTAIADQAIAGKSSAKHRK